MPKSRKPSALLSSDMSETIFALNEFTLLNRVPSGTFNRVKMDISYQLFEI